MPEVREVLNLKNIVEVLLSSYEKRIESINSIFDTTQSILNDFQESLLNTKEEREKTSTQLREILAKNENLRKKDFDNMMEGILLTQSEREKEVRALLKEYLDEQKIMTQALRENLGKFKDSLARGEAARVKEFQILFKALLAKQEERKEEITSKLKRFQKQHNELANSLRELLLRGDNLRIKDFKLMLEKFKTQREERLALQRRRKEAVAGMLKGFRKERLKIRSSPKAVHPHTNSSITPQNQEIGVEVNIDVQGVRQKK